MTNISFARPLAAGLAVALASAIFLASGDAAATITLGTPQIAVPNGYTRWSTRPTADQYWISYEDCKNNVQISWSVDTTDSFFSWAASAAGTCPLASGTTTTSALEQCWQPATGASNLPSGSTVMISAQDLVQGTLGVTNCDPTTAPAGAGISWPQPVTVYFYSPSTNPTDLTTWTQTSIALEGPVPPVPLTVGFGDQEIVTQFPVPRRTGTPRGTTSSAIPCRERGARRTAGARPARPRSPGSTPRVPA